MRRPRSLASATVAVAAVAPLLSFATATAAAPPEPGPGAAVAAPAVSVATDAAYPGLTSTPVLTGLAGAGRLPVRSRRQDLRRQQAAASSALFDGPGDTTPTTALDLRGDVYDHGDRGLLGLALDPAFATGRPYLYVLYSLRPRPVRHHRGPALGRRSTAATRCPEPPGADDRRLHVVRPPRPLHGAAPTASADPSSATRAPRRRRHTRPVAGASSSRRNSIGMVEFGRGRHALRRRRRRRQLQRRRLRPVRRQEQQSRYAGQPVRRRARGPRHRARRRRRRAAERCGRRRSAAPRPTGYVSLGRRDPARRPDDRRRGFTGNPLLNNGIAGDDRIVAYGLRNPYRFAFRPGTERAVARRPSGGARARRSTRFTAGSAPDDRAELRLAVLRGRRPSRAATTAPTSTSARALYATPSSRLGGVTSPLARAVPSVAARRRAAGAPVHERGGGLRGRRPVRHEHDVAGGAAAAAYVFADPPHGCIAALQS